MLPNNIASARARVAQLSDLDLTCGTTGNTLWRLLLLTLGVPRRISTLLPEQVGTAVYPELLVSLFSEALCVGRAPGFSRQ